MPNTAEITPRLLAPVPTAFWWKIKTVLLTVIWAVRNSPNRKTWSEFYHGLIPHKCEFDYNNCVDREKYGGYYKCKHYGCNMVSITDENGNFNIDK